MTARPPLTYHGGKHRIAPWVISFFPPHFTYVEAFGGMGGVLLNKPRSDTEVYNDLDLAVVNFFRVLRDPASRARLIEMIDLTPFAREEYDKAWEKPVEEEGVDAAWRFCVRARMSFGSKGASATRKVGFRSPCKDHDEARIWATLHKDLSRVGKRLQQVTIENLPALEILEKHDTPDTLFYLDPPYLPSTRESNGRGNYRRDMSAADHAALLTKIQNVQGMVILSGYDSALYGEALAGWEKHQMKTLAAASRGTTSRIETLWLCPRAAQATNGRLFS